MLTILWILLASFFLTASFSWLLDNNGHVLITWLGYELQTDVLTAILISAFFSLIVFAISYLFARILAIKFPSLLKFIFRKSYLKA